MIGYPPNPEFHSAFGGVTKARLRRSHKGVTTGTKKKCTPLEATIFITPGEKRTLSVAFASEGRCATVNSTVADSATALCPSLSRNE